MEVDEIFVHENYTNTGSKENDIALLRLGNVSLKQSKDDMESNFLRSTSFPMNVFSLNDSSAPRRKG